MIPFPSTDIVSDWNVTNRQRLLEPIEKQNTVDGAGYGRGFHDLSDIIYHILKHHRRTWVRKKSAFQKLESASNASATDVPAHKTLPSQRNKHRKVQISYHINQAMLPDLQRTVKTPVSHNQFSKSKTKKSHSMKNLSQRKVSRSRNNSSHFKKAFGHLIHSVKPLTNRLSKHLPSLSTKALRDQRRKMPNGRLRTSSGHRKEFTETVHNAAQEPYLPTAQLSPRIHRHNTIGTRVSPTTKLRNLRRQLARLKAKLNRYLHPRK